jgi:diamine N-acetyltransferase
LNDKVSLRRAVIGDESLLALVGSATFLETYAELLPAADILAHCDHKHAPQVYRDWIQANNCACWLVEAGAGRAPIGYMVMGPSTLPVVEPAATDLEIIRIYVLHRYQRSGIGRLLLRAAVNQALEAAGKRLLLGVYSRNDQALAFYARMGFSRVGDRIFKVGDSEYFDYVLGLDLRDSVTTP